MQCGTDSVSYCARSFHVNSGLEGSSFSSPLESPEVPITSSVATLQSAESLNLKRQVRLSSGHCKDPFLDNPNTNETNTDKATNTLFHQSPSNQTTKIKPIRLIDRNHVNNNNDGDILLHNTSFSQTPDTPSANLSSTKSSPDNYSQAFSSHFVSQSSLCQTKNGSEDKEPTSPSAVLTPSTDFSLEADGLNFEDIDLLKFDEDPWDIGNLDYEFQCLNLDDYFKSSKSSS